VISEGIALGTIPAGGSHTQIDCRLIHPWSISCSRVQSIGEKTGSIGARHRSHFEDGVTAYSNDNDWTWSDQAANRAVNDYYGVPAT
jgi:hypothetical protein